MSLFETIAFNPIGDERGVLIALEGNRNIPFEIKRVYYIYGAKNNISRGFHAHRNLKQVAVCLAGSCRIELDNGKKKQEVILDDSTKGILIEEYIWREMSDFSADCVLMVLASEYYDESDYIRDYKLFKKEVENEK